ncbi:MAG: 16S rRNA (cytosine(1402)-N(4))-methyltransferase RsmH [Armatimonadetes bacterium]|nr:16S rRNA (cytosine(1402)-N(4))-methyltransferase RsmH [Armatimonadota bacterium]NOG92291.1 16S rRNA (cytosine(1402)-N(4))-methyltransferase RsmH [Armatimonadota bacterium]
MTLERHRPVMAKETLDALRLPEGGVAVDATVGHGGHALAMLQALGENGTLVAMDWDETMLENAKQALANAPGRVHFVHADYRRLPEELDVLKIDRVDGILYDLGVNREHFEDPLRGFSFLRSGPLDMRMDRSAKETAAAWLGRATYGEIARALREFGGERHAAEIAKRIVERKKAGTLRTTDDLVEAVLEAVPPHRREKRIHPATRTFQAIRIAVNQELEDLDYHIERAAERLAPGGRMVTLSYHSGEDRAAKNAFRNLSRSGFKVITKKPIAPSTDEVASNPSARSAKLRCIERNEEH